MLRATEYPGGRQFLKLALKWGTLYHRIYFDLPYNPKTILHWCQRVSWDPMNEKTMLLKNKHLWALQNFMVTMVTLNAILTVRGVHTKSTIS